MPVTMMQKINNANTIPEGYMFNSKNLIDELLESLNSNAIEYCHWKSNYSLDKSLSGEIDLDLLVDRSSLPFIIPQLIKLGFKMATVKWGIQDPGIYHYYGCDSFTGQLIHVHLFNHVLSGERV